MLNRARSTVRALAAALVALAALAAAMPIAESSSFSLSVSVVYPQANLPKGATMALRGAGCGLNWNSGLKLAYGPANTWTTTLSCSKGVAQMKALVNDADWMLGANAEVSVLGSGDFVVYPWFQATKGSYSYIRNVFSPQLNNTRDLVIYVPPSYAENTLKVYTNVMLMQDGQNLFNESTSFAGAWFCQDTVNLLTVEGKMEDVILVGIDNTADRMSEYTFSVDAPYSTTPKGNQYLDFVEQTVVPIVTANFRVAKTPEWAILGSSLGGLISCYAGWTRSLYANAGIFSAAGCMSTSFWWADQSFAFGLMDDNAPPPTETVFYIDSGTGGGSSTGSDDEMETIAVVMHFEQLGWVLNGTLAHYVQQGGVHNEASWGARFWVPMQFIYAIKPIEVGA